MIKMHKYFDEIVNLTMHEASLMIPKFGYISATAHTEEHALHELEVCINTYNKAVKDIDYDKFEYIEMQ